MEDLSKDMPKSKGFKAAKSTQERLRFWLENH
jgi:hypothetical protein